MPRDEKNVQALWIDFSDFSNGIIHNLGYNSMGGSLTGWGYGPGDDKNPARVHRFTQLQENLLGANGVASIDGTFGCIALPGGGLGPLPRRDVSLSLESQKGANTITDWYVQAFINGPFVWRTGLTNATFPRYDYMKIRDNPDNTPAMDVYMGMDAYDAAASKRFYRLVRGRVFRFGFDLSSSASSQWMKLSNATFSNGISDTNALASSLNGPTYFARQRFNPTTPAQTGNPTVTSVWTRPGGVLTGAGANDCSAILNPNPTTLTDALDWWTIASGQYTGVPIGHQNRMVWLGRNTFFNSPTQSGTASIDGIRINDQMYYTSPNNTAIEGVNIAFGYEDAVSYGAWASISSSDLLLIRHVGGAVYIQGDLNNPSVRNMPGVVSTNGTECAGAQTPIGFVYGINRGGVYVYSGGDSSQNLSPQLPPDFWIHSDANHIQDYRGRFASWGNWVMCPNGFLYDTQQNGWWRMENPATYLPYEYFPGITNGYLYANVPKWTEAAPMTGYFQGYNGALGQNSYSWSSQPIYPNINRVLRVRELVVVMQGASGSTVAVTFTNADGSTASKTFTLAGSADTPQVQRVSFISRSSTNIRVKIVATGSGSAAAPVVHTLRMNCQEAEHLA